MRLESDSQQVSGGSHDRVQRLLAELNVLRGVSATVGAALSSTP